MDAALRLALGRAQAGKITPAEFNGFVVQIAWRFVEIGMPLRGMALLHNVAPAYLNGPFQEAAAADPALNEAGRRFAAYLVSKGFVAGVDGRDVAPTGQVPGQA